ncbi:MAG: DUF1080 domain-containing protein [Lentisphaerales bacterium]|nr:DUF1080 domain-containing protein [Lentisphaerales bacterium]
MKKFALLALLLNSAYGQSAPELCQQLVMDGSGSDAKARTALMKLSHSAVLQGKDNQLKHEAALLKKLNTTKSQDLATFLLQQLEICGTEKSLPVIAKLLNDPQIGENAASTLTKLATYDPSLASELLITAYNKATDKKAYLLNAMSILKLKDSRSLTAYRSQAQTKSLNKQPALQGLAVAGQKQDSKLILDSFTKAEKIFRGRAFRLNLVYAKNLAQVDKSSALKHLSALQSGLNKSDIPYQTGILSVKMKIQGVSAALLQSLSKANIHTQSAVTRLLKSGQYGNPTETIIKLVKASPDEVFYLQALTAVAPAKAAPYISQALNSKNAETKNAAVALSKNFGSDFAPSLIKTLMAKGEITKEEIQIAKSMIHPAKVSEITALWQNLSPALEIAFIDMTAQIREPEVAAKVIAATGSQDSKVKRAAQKVLKDVVSPADLRQLIQLLNAESSSSAVRYIQAGVASSIAQSDDSVAVKLAKMLNQKRNDKLLVAFAKSNKEQVLPLLHKDLLSGKSELQKETIKTLSSMSPELSCSLLTLAVTKTIDDRNKILAVRALSSAVTQSSEPNTKKKEYLEKALKAKPAAKEAKMLQDILNKLSTPKKKKRKAGPTSSGAGYSPLFHGKDLSHWDNEGDYKVKDGVIYGTNGNLWSKKTYKNFSLKFEFKLHPATNNGLAIRTPKGQRPIELQIIDNQHPKYKKIKDYQRHGSLYSYAPAKTGFLKSAGEWNQQEVICDGSMLTVILNGTKILEADLKTVKQVPGSRYKINYINEATEGRIGFLGHRTPIEIRQVEIKEL